MSAAVHATLVAIAVLMSLRMAFHLACCHAMVTKGIAWKPDLYWHAHLVLASISIAAAVTW